MAIIHIIVGSILVVWYARRREAPAHRVRPMLAWQTWFGVSLVFAAVGGMRTVAVKFARVQFDFTSYR